MSPPGSAATPRLLTMLFILGANWGLSFSMAKYGALGGVSALGYAAWQMTGAGLALLFVARLRGHAPPITPAHLRYYVLSGVGALALPAIVFLTVIRHVPVGVTALLTALAPLLTYGFSLALGQERFHWRRAAGTALGLAGALLILLPKASLPEPGMAGWVAFGLLTPVCYAGTNVYMARARPPGADSMALAASMQWAGAALLIPLALATGGFHTPAIPFGMGEYAILGAMALASFGSIVYLEILRQAGPVFLSQVGYIVTLTGIAWGALLFGERHSPWFWAAAATILAGLALVSRPTARE